MSPPQTLAAVIMAQASGSYFRHPVRCPWLLCQLSATPGQINWAPDSEEGLSPNKHQAQGSAQTMSDSQWEMGLLE